MSDPRLSIIVPTYNYARYLPHALESIAAQTFTDWECVIVDDGSSDGTEAIGRSWTERDPRYRYVHQRNAGLAAARNTGIRNARGSLFQFLDADDRLQPLKLARHVQWLDQHPETDIVYSEVAFFFDDDPGRLMPSLGGKLARSIMARVHGNAEALGKLEHYNIMPVLAAVVRRTAFDRAGGFDESAPACEDWGFWIRCAVVGCRFDFFDSGEPLAAVRSHGASMSRDMDRMMRGLVEIARAFEKSDARRLWSHSGRLPLAYELAFGIDAVDRGRHVDGFRHIRRAAWNATEGLTRIRWSIYAVAALFPRAVFRRVITTPVPERPFELYRRLRAALRGKR